MDNPFVHLHVHTEYSLLDGGQRINQLVKKAAEFKMPALAITDHGMMHGVIDFYDSCKKNGVKPIIGVEIYITPGKMTDKTAKSGKGNYHLLLLAKDMIGYKNLLKLVSIASIEGFYYKPRIDHETLAKYSEGLIAASSCLKGEIPAALLAKNKKKAQEITATYRDIFGKENFYIELQDHGLQDQRDAIPGLIEIANEFDLKLIATNDVHYLNANDYEAHDILLCIQTGKTKDDEDRLKYGSDQFYFKSEKEMREQFRDIPSALTNTFEIAERCNVELEFGKAALPIPDIPDSLTPFEYLTKLCYNNLPKRMPAITPEVEERLAYELKVIGDTPFPSYFLIVKDFAQFARDKGIYFGVRGSAAGSLVSYLIGITDIDPIEYGLTFERFLNPQRVSMPDIDMDFEDTRREDVIRYVTEKYGSERVAQIVTYGTMAAKAAIRDAGRVLGIPLPEVDKIAKLVPTAPGTTIEKAMEAITDLKTLYDTNQTAQKVLDTAKSIEGMPRSTGIHAAGVIISRDPIVEYVPMSKGQNGELVTQYGANHLEKIGLLKMDFLGLSNLSVLAKAVENVKRSRGIDIDIRNIPLDDKKTYDMLSAGDVVGVFQLEGGGMRRNLMELKPRNVRELAALVALYRPGPMEQIPKYIRSKFGLERPTYLHPGLEPILKETYGVIVYQDQVLRIVQAIAGFSLGEADILRKAMGKKQRETMEKMRDDFVKRAVERGVKEKTAKEIFELIEPFAGYAFNKAHATCYGMVAYQTGYLKANYTAEYMAALMAVYRGKEEKITKSIEECKRKGIAILPPDVNKSDVDFTFEDGAVRFGLGAIKGVGEAAVEGILKAAAQGSFTSIFDFCERTKEFGNLNRSCVEALIKAGAFDKLHGNRHQLIDSIDIALSYADKLSRDKAMGQNSLFEGGAPGSTVSSEIPPLAPARDVQTKDLLNMEREVMGMYISGHPLNSVAGQLLQAATASIAELHTMKDGDAVTIGGIITNVKTMFTKKNNEKMAIVMLEDMSGQVSITVFPRTLAKTGDFMAKDKLILVNGKVNFREKVNTDEGGREAEIRAENITLLTPDESNTDSYEVGACFIHLERSTRVQLNNLKNIIAENPGEMPVYVDIKINGDCKRTRLKNRIKGDEAIVQKVGQIIDKGYGNKILVRRLVAKDPIDEPMEHPLSEFINVEDFGEV